MAGGSKSPGRIGDSPIIGAGNYADNRFGAAACTGRGEMAIRASSAHSVVSFMRHGMSLDAAIRQAMTDLAYFPDKFAERENVMNIVAMDAHGNVTAASTSNKAEYVVQTVEMNEYDCGRAFTYPHWNSTDRRDARAAFERLRLDRPGRNGLSVDIGSRNNADPIMPA